MIYTNHYESPLGSILLAGDEEGLTGLWFTQGSRYSASFQPQRSVCCSSSMAYTSFFTIIIPQRCIRRQQLSSKLTKNRPPGGQVFSYFHNDGGREEVYNKVSIN